MCTGLEAVLIGSTLLGAAGSAAQTMSAQKSARRQADARNAALATFLDKNEELSAEAQEALQKRLAVEEQDPTEGVNQLIAPREEVATTSIGRQSVAAPIPLGGNVPKVVASDAAAAQGQTDADARRRARDLANTRAFGDLLFNRGLATEDARRDIGQVNSFAQANARLLPIQQDLAQQAAASRGGTLGTIGGIASALGSLGSAAAGGGGFGVFGGGGSAAPLTSPLPRARPINLGF